MLLIAIVIDNGRGAQKRRAPRTMTSSMMPKMMMPGMRINMVNVEVEIPKRKRHRRNVKKICEIEQSAMRRRRKQPHNEE